MTYQEYLDRKPVIVTAALTGGVHGKEANPNLPERPAEIGAAAAACADAGASIVHLHARQDNGERAFDRERFQAIDEAIRDRTDELIIQHSTGGTGAPLEKRIEALRTDPPPEMASLDMGPMNRYDHLTSENTRAMVDAFHEEMLAKEIKPEIEVFNNGHLNEVYALLERTDLASPPYINCIVGPGTLTPPTPGNFLNLLQNLPEGAEFNTLGIGPHQLAFATLGILMGGHIRVGLEDNVYYDRGELAESNAQLVERIVDIAERLGRPIATPTQTREILEL
ncbi:MAG: 3-keto-5-aminohexanoate cleavage protein [Halobacteriales archaeon]